MAARLGHVPETDGTEQGRVRLSLAAAKCRETAPPADLARSFVGSSCEGTGQALRIRLGIMTCLLAGCATQPVTPMLQPDVAAARLAAILPATCAPRIGVEFLPPENPDATAAPEIAAAPSRRPAPAPAGPVRLVDRVQVREDAHTWRLSVADLDAVDDPIAREALRFCDDLVREDARRTQREVRLPFLEWRPAELDLGARLWSEERIGETRAQWVDDHLGSLLGSPFRRMLRRLPLVSAVEVSLDDFRSSFVPATEPYLRTHDDGGLGRVSLRLRAGDPGDPVEVAYILGGARVATSRDRTKLGYAVALSERVDLELRATRDYRTNHDVMRLDLGFRYSPTTSFHMALGDDMDFLSTSSIYSLFETPMDGSPGMLVYAVHVF